MQLSVIIPAHNEAENIAELIKKIERELDFAHELIVVNDHSLDSTKELVRKLMQEYTSLRLLDNNLNKGLANALKTGFRQAKGDVVIPIMGDLCDDLATVRLMLREIEKGFDIVCGSRYIKNGARIGGSRLKGFLSFLGGWSIHYLFGLPIHDIANAFKMYRKKVLDAIEIKTHGFEVSMEITLKAFYLGFKIAEVPTIWKERERGQSSFKVLRQLPAYLRLYFWALGRKCKG